MKTYWVCSDFEVVFCISKSHYLIFLKKWDGTIENEIANNKNRYYDQDQFL